MDKLEDDLNGSQEIIGVFENLLASFLLFVSFDKMLGRHTGCKENHFYSLPFGQAEASIY